MDELDRLMTRKEVARYLGLNVNTIQRWHWKGSDAPPFIKIGRSVRYKESEVKAWVERTTAKPKARTIRLEWQAVGADGQPFGPVHVGRTISCDRPYTPYITSPPAT